jgi:hypothetical protein
VDFQQLSPNYIMKPTLREVNDSYCVLMGLHDIQTRGEPTTTRSSSTAGPEARRRRLILVLPRRFRRGCWRGSAAVPPKEQLLVSGVQSRVPRRKKREGGHGGRAGAGGGQARPLHRHRREGTAPIYLLRELLSDSNRSLCLLSLPQKDSFESLVMEHIRLNGAYWGLTTLDLLHKLHTVDSAEVVEWIMSCYHPESGTPAVDSSLFFLVFGGGLGSWRIGC